MTDSSDPGVPSDPQRGHTGPGIPIIDLTTALDTVGGDALQLRALAAMLDRQAERLVAEARVCRHVAHRIEELRTTLNGDH